MPEDKEIFNPNPFLNIDASKFPKKAGQKNTKIKKKDNDDTEADNALFLHAVCGKIQLPQNQKISGFSLGEQCKLPEKVKKKQFMQETVQKKIPKIEAEDANAFLLAMRNTIPLGGKGRKVAPQPAVPSTPPLADDPAFEDLLAENLTFAVSFSDEYMEGPVAGLDELILNRLRAGELSPEAHLDLHGLNAVQAFETLREFMRSSWFKGLRVILIVPGRGKNSPDGQGVLRRKLQSWLTQDPFKRVVLAFCTAQPVDGGPGSIYVLLRKYRKKGRIYWERMPADADLY